MGSTCGRDRRMHLVGLRELDGDGYGTRLTVYVSAASTDQPQVAQDVLDAERLGFRQGPTRAGTRSIRYVVVRENTISAQARTVIQDASAIAYIGEVVPHSSYASLGITNAVDLLQVSPTDTALELTETTTAVPDLPTATTSCSVRTGGRSRASSRTAARKPRRRCRRCNRSGSRSCSSRPTAAPTAGGDRERGEGRRERHDHGRRERHRRGRRVLRLGLAHARRALLQLGGGVGSVGQAVRPLGARRARVHLGGVAVGRQPLHLGAGFPPAGPDPRRAHIRPGLHQHLRARARGSGDLRLRGGGRGAVRAQAGGASAGDRTTVVHDFFAIKNRQSVLGTYSIDSNGDTSIAPFVFTRLKGGHAGSSHVRVSAGVRLTTALTRAEGRRSAAGAMFAAIIGVSGCGSSSGHTLAATRIPGKTLTIYASAPLLGRSSVTGRSVVDAARLALDQRPTASASTGSR